MEKKDNIGLILLATLLIGGYLIYANYVKKNTISTSTTNPTTPPVATVPVKTPSSINNFYKAIPPCIQVTYTTIPNNSRVIVYIDCNGNPRKTTLLDGSINLSIQEGSSLYYDVPYDFTTKLKIYPEYPVTTKADPSIILPQELHDKGFYEGMVVTSDFFAALVAYNAKQEDVINQRQIKAQENVGGYNYITQGVTYDNGTSITAQIEQGIRDGSVFTPNGDKALLGGTKNFQFIISAVDAGLVSVDLMGNLQSLGIESHGISQVEVNNLNQAMQDAQNNSNNSLSNADLYNVCMQNATTSLQQDYCKNTVSSADAR